MLSSLETAIHPWDAYDQCMFKVTQVLTDAEYTLDIHQVDPRDAEETAHQLAQLKVIHCAWRLITESPDHPFVNFLFSPDIMEYISRGESADFSYG